MAEAFFNHIARGRALVSSAGTQPASEINPTVVRVMREAGLDISRQKPKALTLEMANTADRAITMGCGAEKVCPASFVPMEDWQIEDPEEKPIEKVREIRDEIKARVIKLVSELNNKSPLNNPGKTLNQSESNSVSIESKGGE